jgi:hypothetical protein
VWGGVGWGGALVEGREGGRVGGVVAIAAAAGVPSDSMEEDDI